MVLVESHGYSWVKSEIFCKKVGVAPLTGLSKIGVLLRFRRLRIKPQLAAELL
jgi:hypothetical protein